MNKIFLGLSLLILCSGCLLQNSKSKKNTQKHKRVTELPNEILTAKMIDTTSDAALQELVVENLTIKVYINQGKPDKGFGTIMDFSSARKAIYLISNMELKYNNGGFNNYYWHLDGHKLAKMLPSAFETIGAPQCAEEINKLNKFYASHEDEIMAFKDSTVESYIKFIREFPLTESNQRFLEIYEAEKVPIRIVRFIRKYKEDFIDE